jgi:RNA polymerase-interacting CarD/CdnL/TRCF family regulator
MQKLKTGDIVVVKDHGVSKIGKITEVGRKGKSKVFSVIMENGTHHTHLQTDVKNSMYYIDTNATAIINKNIEV